MKTIFVVSFGAFESGKRDVSELIAKNLRKNHIGGNVYTVETYPQTIPSYDRGFAVFEAALDMEAHCVIVLTPESDTTCVSIQTRAENFVNDVRRCNRENLNSSVDETRGYRELLSIDLSRFNVGQSIRERRGMSPSIDYRNEMTYFSANHLTYQMLVAQKRISAMAKVPFIVINLPVISGEVTVDNILTCIGVILQNAQL